MPKELGALGKPPGGEASSGTDACCVTASTAAWTNQSPNSSWQDGAHVAFAVLLWGIGVGQDSNYRNQALTSKTPELFGLGLVWKISWKKPDLVHAPEGCYGAIVY